MSIRRIGAGARMSQAVIHGNTAYLAGCVARDPEGKDVAAQTKDILEQIDATLAKAGTDKTKLLSATIWLSDISTFDQMNKVWDGWVSQGNTPARATVEAKLAAPRFKVEIGIVAAGGSEDAVVQRHRLVTLCALSATIGVSFYGLITMRNGFV